MSKNWKDPRERVTEDEAENYRPAEGAHGGHHPCLVMIKGPLIGSIFELRQDTHVVGRAHDADIVLHGDGISRRHAVIDKTPEGWMVTDLDSTNGLFINGERVKKSMLRENDYVQFGSAVSLKFLFEAKAEAAFQREVFELITRDSLTKVFNRRYFLDTLHLEWAHVQRSNLPLSVLLLDIDLFKKVNDTYGHLAGDMALLHTAQVIQQTLRGIDVLARYGGEEFAVLLRNTDTERAIVAAERIREAVAASRLRVEEALIAVTVSIGVVSLPDPHFQSEAALLACADTRLYKAKALGRNRTVALDTATGSPDTTTLPDDA